MVVPVIGSKAVERGSRKNKSKQARAVLEHDGVVVKDGQIELHRSSMNNRSLTSVEPSQSRLK